jgi:hypothetical protein
MDVLDLNSKTVSLYQNFKSREVLANSLWIELWQMLDVP